MRMMAAWMLVAMGIGTAVPLANAETPATEPATQASTKPKNLDKALDDEVTFDLKNLRLEDAIASLRTTTQTNIAVNWPALALAGITRDTPVTLRVSKVTYEQAVRAIVEQLPTKGTRANYLVGDNALEITTTAELGKLSVVKLFDLSNVLAISMSGKPTAEERAKHAEFLKQIIHMELVKAGEDVDRQGRELALKDDFLAATQSRRGQLYIQQTIWRFAAPIRMTDRAAGTALSVQAKKAEEKMKSLCTDQAEQAALVALAKDPAKAPELNVVLLPGAQTAVEKGEGELDYTVTEGGIVLLGPAADIRGRTLLVVYDLKELLKRMAFKSKQKPAPSLQELADSVVTQLTAKVPAGRYKGAAWGDMGKAPAAMALYENLLVVTGSTAVQRGVAAGLQELYR